MHRSHDSPSDSSPRKRHRIPNRVADAARRARDDTAGTHALIEILLAHRIMNPTAFTAAMDHAVASGCLDAQVVLIDARRDSGQVAAVVPIGALAR